MTNIQNKRVIEDQTKRLQVSVELTKEIFDKVIEESGLSENIHKCAEKFAGLEKNTIQATEDMITSVNPKHQQISNSLDKIVETVENVEFMNMKNEFNNLISGIF
ncbi:hypothetical protein M0813_05190 [Anaeramoeba flamelloides]|uniref:BLOC-1-related complex subunit 7 n=1 Tax=Anaeramoeba flamelloides TaxID=1746091 RepID=A0ABQ8XIB2_9EUKA|nr:hypothetical protein M0813_05190 [Anaeramoeba flamelloides]